MKTSDLSDNDFFVLSYILGLPEVEDDPTFKSSLLPLKSSLNRLDTEELAGFRRMFLEDLNDFQEHVNNLRAWANTFEEGNDER